MFSKGTNRETPAAVALDCLEAGIRSTQPERVVREKVTVGENSIEACNSSYETAEYSEIVVIGGGNAAGRMAAVLEDLLGERITDGVIVTDDVVDLSRIEVFEGSHPIPDRAGQVGTQRLLEVADNADEETLVLAIIAGGGSALLPAPSAEISLGDLRSVTDELLTCGAPIDEINAVRKHLSELKGGRLAGTLAPATTVGLLISDVAGNDASTVASGPLVPDPTTFDDALRVIQTYGIDVPERVRRHFRRGVEGEIQETPRRNASFFDDADVHILADNRTAIDAAGDVARDRGYERLVLSSRVRGEAREVAKMHVAIAEEVRATGTPCEEPAVILTGGETTVTIRGDGNGGPNQEFALSAAIELSDSQIACASVDTDGIDGTTDACGALVDDTTVTSIADAETALADNNAYPFLADADSLLFSGTTGTNVNDLRVIVVGTPASEPDKVAEER